LTVKKGKARILVRAVGLCDFRSDGKIPTSRKGREKWGTRSIFSAAGSVVVVVQM